MKQSGWAVRLASMFRSSASAALESVESLTRRGVVHLDAGEFDQACDVFRQAADLEPAVAAHQVNLAYALQQAGSRELALLHLQQAVALDVESFDAHYMLGAALERDGNLPAAAQQLRHAVRLKPDFAPAYADLGRVLAANGDKREARAALEVGLTVDATHAPLHLYLGNVCMELDEPEAAHQHYTRADKLSPGSSEILAKLGRTLRACKDLDGAMRCFEAALAVTPDAASVHLNVGITLKLLDRSDEAAAALQRAIELAPDDADAHNILGTVLAEQGRLPEAIVHYQRAIQLRPDLPGAYGNLGLAMYQQGKVAEAIVHYRKGLAIRSVAEIHDNLGIALQKQGAPDEAIEHYRKALALQPDNVNTRCNLAVALAGNAGYAEGIQAHREILAHKPDHLVAYSNLLHYLSVDADVSPAAYLAEAAQLDAQLTRTRLPQRQDLDPERRPLRVGIVSGDLRVHPVGYFIEGMLKQLADNRLELHGYPTTAIHDELTDRIRPQFAGWRSLKGLGDEAAARAIYADGIDILIDLAGHTGDNRLPVFAWRPAPLQVSWLGYWASTGVSAIDYVLADALCVPPGQEHQFTEKVWRLPETRMCFTPPAEGIAPEIAPLPALARGHLTFGCFQRMPKINDRVLALWSRVLSSLPDARLLVQSELAGRPKYAGQLRDRLQAVGIAPERVEIRGPAPRAAYLRSYAEVDIVLDTFPFTGGTTTCEALWMGVPTLTLTGDSMIARQGLAMMTLAGLPEWVAADPDDFVAKARAWAARVPELAALRTALRGRLPATPLFDAARFAPAFSDALQEMWRAHLLAANSAAD